VRRHRHSHCANKKGLASSGLLQQLSAIRRVDRVITNEFLELAQKLIVKDRCKSLSAVRERI
jgi:hypothetical protein